MHVPACVDVRIGACVFVCKQRGKKLSLLHVLNFNYVPTVPVSVFVP